MRNYIPLSQAWYSSTFRGENSKLLYHSRGSFSSKVILWQEGFWDARKLVAERVFAIIHGSEVHIMPITKSIIKPFSSKCNEEEIILSQSVGFNTIGGMIVEELEHSFLHQDEFNELVRKSTTLWKKHENPFMFAKTQAFAYPLHGMD